MYGKYTVNQNVINIAKTLNEAGFVCFIAGGFVRDSILGRESKDIDLVTNAIPEQIEELFERTIPLGRSFGVITVQMNNEQFEVATLRKDSVKSDGRRPESVEFTADLFADASRRDFTINAMFMNPLTGEIIDLVGGKDDLLNHRLRTVGNARERFQEDHLRMLRAIRFGVTHNLAVNDNLLIVIRDNADLIIKISAERVREELMKILAHPSASLGIRMMHWTGILDLILPEVSALNGVEQPAIFHPEGDVFSHTMIALGSGKTAIERLAILLHDIGKPATAKFNPEKGRIQFLGHDMVGAELAEKVMQRLRFSNAEIAEVTFAVRNHMKMHNLADMRRFKQLTLVHREHFKTLKAVAIADVRGTLSDPTELIRLISELEAVELPPRILRGDDLIAIGATPGKRFGKILDKVRQQQLQGNVKTKEQALRLAKRML